MLNAMFGARDLILTKRELLTLLRQPGRAYVFAKITPHDENTVQVVKSDLISTIELIDAKVFECHVEQDDDGKSNLYVGW